MNRIGGFSLVELLVAIMILSIGLLGLAALQIAGVRSNQTAYYRSVATQLAYDIADRMRANPVGVANGAYNSNKLLTPDTSLTQQCETASCTPDALAVYDLKQWAYALKYNLPGGLGAVCSITSSPSIGDSSSPGAGCAVTAGNTYAVYVWWNDNRSGSTTQGFVTSFQIGN